jgi:Macrocin-O-methyltransferase (TylF)
VFDQQIRSAFTESSDMVVIRGRDSEEVWDYENAFYWFSHPTRLNKLIAHYELYKTITRLPGDILELGVYKAASLIRWATFRNVLENDFSRKIVGFDAFGKFPTEGLKLTSDMDFIDEFESSGGEGLSKEEVASLLASKGFQNIHLRAGNIFNTLPEYISQNPATRISLLHLDTDVKEPTAFALDHLYARIVPNGIIVLDDYNSVAGETDAVDEFIARKQLHIEKSSHYSAPAFVRKPCAD